MRMTDFGKEVLLYSVGAPKILWSSNKSNNGFVPISWDSLIMVVQTRVECGGVAVCHTQSFRKPSKSSGWSRIELSGE
jgi:hypothetical protein